MKQLRHRRAESSRGARSGAPVSIAESALYVVESLEARLLLVSSPVSIQSKILVGLPAHLHGVFSGTHLELSHTVATKGYTPGYVLIDKQPKLSPKGNLAPFATSAPTGLTPAQMRQAYVVNNITFGSVIGDGRGQTIAIIDAYDDPTATSDLHAFDAYFGLPDPPSFTKVNQTGGTTLPGVDPAGKGDDWEIEEALDIEWAHAMSPGANIMLVEANSPFDSDLITAAVGWARSAPGVSAVSMSFGRSESSGDTAENSTFTTPNGHQGVTFLASTGDNGAPGGFPAYSPNVLAVGGTTLNVNSSGTYQSETAWSFGGGGISAFETQPGFQKGVVTQSTTQRTIPDVSADADPYTGVPVFDSYDFGTINPWAQYGGTSLSSPCWAGLIAIVNQGRALGGSSSLDGPSQTLPRLYSIPASNFHDITSGNNGQFSAQPGYDLASGRGTPVANSLVTQLSAYGPYVVSDTPTGLQATAPSFIDFNFNTAMNPASFSIASDIDSFTGPFASNVLSSITGFSWVNGNTTLQINFNPASAQGPYTMTIGPQILSSTGAAMDQNQNGITGETPGDTYAATFYYDTNPLQVASTTPAVGSTVTPPFTSLTIRFNKAINPAKVSVNNLTLSQGAVSSTQVLDSTDVTYTLSGVTGSISVSMAAGALTDAAGDPMLPFTAQYTLPMPAPTGAPVLLAATDSGISNSDAITNFDNSTAGKALQFSVSGTIPGDTVGIYADHTLIGSATANSTTTTVTTDGTTALSWGAHSITARQGPTGALSVDSAPLSITILNAALPLPAAGAFDTTFNSTGINVSTQLTGYGAWAEAVQADGKLVVAGAATAPGYGTTSAAVARYNAYGQLDPTFGTGGYVITRIASSVETARAVAIQSDGKIVVLVTPMDNDDDSQQLEVVRYNTNGSLDTTFGSGGIDRLTPGTTVAAGSLVIQPDGKLVIAATSTNSQYMLVGVLIRLNSNGAFDSTFNGHGYVASSIGGNSIYVGARITSDGHILVAGSFSTVGNFNILLTRYTSTGTLDTTFSGTGYVTTAIGSGYSNGEGLALQSDGKIVVNAFGSGLALVRYNINGSLDGSFGKGGIVTFAGLEVWSPVLQGDGKIVVDGLYDDYRGFVERFNANGSADSSFGNNGLVVTQIGASTNFNYFNAVAIQPDGRICAAGISHDVSTGASELTVVRLFGNTASLTLDPASDSGISNSDRITNITSPTFDVPAQSNLYERIYLNGALVSPSYASGNTVTLGIQPQGNDVYTLAYVDAAGNQSPATPSYSITIDTTPPTSSSVTGVPLSSSTTTYPFSVTYSDAKGVVYSSLGNTNILVTNASGYSQFATFVSASPASNAGTITATYQINPPSGGWGAAGTAYTFTLRANSVTDVPGNAANSAVIGTQTVIALNPPGQPQLLLATDSGVSNSDKITNFNNSSSVKAPQFSVPNTTSGLTVTIYADGVAIGSAVAAGTSTVVTTNGTLALSDGIHSVTARQSLAGTQTADSQGLSIIVDSMGPVGAIVGALTPAGTNYNFTVSFTDATAVNAATLGGNNLMVSGAGGYSQLATLVSFSSTSNGSLVVGTYQLPPPAGGWGSGSYAVTLQTSQVGDVAGNFAVGGLVGVLSSTLSAAPGVPVLAPATDSGTSSSDGITNFNNNNPVRALQFFVPATVIGDTVTIYADGTAIGSALASSATTMVITSGSQTLSDGTHSITACQTAPGYLLSNASAALTVTIDTVAIIPLAPFLDPASNPALSGVTNVVGPTVNVMAAEAGTVYLQPDGGAILSAQTSGADVVKIRAITPGGLQSMSALSTGFSNSTVAAGDFNGDGKQDLAVCDATNVQVFFGNRDGTFKAPVTLSNSSGGYYLVAADFNGDGKSDVVAANQLGNGFKVFLGSSNSTFTALTPVTAAVYATPFAFDMNGDGKIDLVARTSPNTSTFSVWLGNGDGTFQAASIFNDGVIGRLAVGDITGDGKPDVFAFSGGNPASVSVVRNTGNNTFSAPVVTSINVDGSNYVTAGDFNNDGKADVVIATVHPQDQILLSNGDGTFEPPITFTTDYNPTLLTTGDFNHDGKMDVAIGINATLYIGYGNGDGTVQTPVTYALSVAPQWAAAVDLNGDGDVDLALANSLTSNNVAIYLATGGALGVGTHSLTTWETDLAGNTSGVTTSSMTIDQTVPTAGGFVGPLATTPAVTAHTFTVTYTDNFAVNVAGLGNANVLVTGPDGYSQAATFVSATPAANSPSIVATYQPIPPAAGWSSAANGTYTVALQPSQVSDSAGNFVVAKTMGTFGITIASATARPQLLAVTDTGIANSDGITNFNNSTAARKLQFSVPGTQSGDTVSLYADGVLLGSAVAAGATTTVATNGAMALSEGVHSITARRQPAGVGQSADSTLLSVMVDTAAPTAQIAMVPSGVAAANTVSITFSEPVYGLTLPNFQLALNGTSIPLTANQTLATTDHMTWTLGNLAGLTGATGTYHLTLHTVPSFTDTAGNALAAPVSTTWSITTNLQITAGSASNSIYLRKSDDGTSLSVWLTPDRSDTPRQFTLASLTSLSIHGNGAADFVTFDFSAGSFLLASNSLDDTGGGITVNVLGTANSETLRSMARRIR